MHVKSYTMMLYRLLAKLLTRRKLMASNMLQNDWMQLTKAIYSQNVIQSVVIDSAMYFSRSMHL